MARSVLSPSPCVLISAHSSDAPLPQPPILMLRAKRETRKRCWPAVPQGGALWGPVGREATMRCRVCKESRVMLWTSEPEQVWSALFLSNLEVQGTNFNTGTFCGPAEKAESCVGTATCRYVGKLLKVGCRGEEKKKKAWQSNKLFLQQNRGLAKIAFCGNFDGLKISCGEFLACSHARAPAQEQRSFKPCFLDNSYFWVVTWLRYLPCNESKCLLDSKYLELSLLKRLPAEMSECLIVWMHDK